MKLNNHYIFTDGDTGKSFTVNKSDVTEGYDWNPFMAYIIEKCEQSNGDSNGV